MQGPLSTQTCHCCCSCSGGTLGSLLPSDRSQAVLTYSSASGAGGCAPSRQGATPRAPAAAAAPAAGAWRAARSPSPAAAAVRRPPPGTPPRSSAWPPGASSALAPAQGTRLKTCQVKPRPGVGAQTDSHLFRDICCSRLPALAAIKSMALQCGLCIPCH